MKTRTICIMQDHPRFCIKPNHAILELLMSHSSHAPSQTAINEKVHPIDKICTNPHDVLSS